MLGTTRSVSLAYLPGFPRKRMKPFGQEKRPKDWLPVVNFAMAEGVPRSFNLREHLFPYVGCEPDPRYIWGVYGTTSINVAIYSAAHMASRQRRRSLQLTSWILVEDFHKTPAQNDGAFESISYLHLGRAKSSVRKLLREKWIDWIRSRTPEQYERLAEQLDKLSLEDLASHFPGYVRVLLEENPQLRAIVHPVIPEFTDGKSAANLWVLTSKYDKDRVMASEVRFLSDVDVNLW